MEAREKRLKREREEEAKSPELRIKRLTEEANQLTNASSALTSAQQKAADLKQRKQFLASQLEIAKKKQELQKLKQRITKLIPTVPPGITINDLSLKQLRQLSAKTFKTKRQYLRWFDLEPKERKHFIPKTTIEDLTIRQLQQLSGKKYNSKKKFLEWFAKDPLERLKMAELKILAKQKIIPYSGKRKAELISLLKNN